MVTLPEVGASTSPTEVGAWLAGRSASSQHVYAAALQAAARSVGRYVASIDWAALDPAALEMIRENLLAAGRSPSWVNLTLSAVRSLVRHLWRQGLVANERRAHLEDVAGARDSRLPAGRHVESHELAAVRKPARATALLSDFGMSRSSGSRRPPGSGEPSWPVSTWSM